MIILKKGETLDATQIPNGKCIMIRIEERNERVAVCKDKHGKLTFYKICPLKRRKMTKCKLVEMNGDRFAVCKEDDGEITVYKLQYLTLTT